MPFTTSIYVSAASLLSVITCSGALTFTNRLNTDGSGNFTDANTSWTGGATGGTVQSNVSGSGKIIDNFSSGTLTSSVVPAGRITENPFLTEWAITITGGTADLDFENGFRFFIRDLSSNVTSVMIEMNYSTPLAGINTANTGNSSPLGFGVRGIAGSGRSNGNVRQSIQLLNPVHDSDNDGTFEFGVGSGTSVTNLLVDDGGGNYSRNGISNFSLGFLRGHDFAGTTDDEERVYISGQRWEITIDDMANSNTFGSGAEFRFTLDGAQYANLNAAINAVPEPSSMIFLLLPAAGLVLRRQRKQL